MSTFLFDIGGTNMRIAFGAEGVLEVVQKTRTPEDPQEALALLRAFVAAHAIQPTSAVGGIAGVIRDGVIMFAPHLPGWNGFSIADAFEEVLGVPVSLYNDAEIAALGEAREGAGKGHDLVTYMTIGTGVGGTCISHGVSMPHAEGIEPGKQIVEYESGRTLESFVGGAALELEFGMLPQNLARSVFDERTQILATGIYNCIRLWSPQIVILNGSLMNDETAFRLDEVAREVDRIAAGQPMPLFARAHFGDNSGLYGALLK